MFKKPESEDGQTVQIVSSSEPSMSPKTRSRSRATIGPSIQIVGDVTGNEDLRIEGRVEGTISLSDSVLTVGKDAQINATINVRAIFVEGMVEGDLKGEEQVVVHSSGNVRGTIAAPRVTLEDGCKFKGSIDVDVEPSTARAPVSSGKIEKVADIKSAVASSGEAPSGSGLGKIHGH